jgi:hypothetical protein
MRRLHRRVPWAGPPRTRRRVGIRMAGAIALAAVLAGVSACTGDRGGSGSSAGSGTGTPAPTVAATASPGAAPGVQATAFPIPGSPRPEPVPVVKTVTGRDWQLSLNKVSRVSGESVLVEATLTTTKSRELFTDFEEAGFKLRKQEDGKFGGTYEFSAVTLTAPGDARQYLPMRDENGVCACTYGFVVSVDPGQVLPVYVYMSAPASDTVNITVRGFPAFTGVRVQR